MPRYHYQALNSDGVSLEGMLRATNEREAARALERRGLSVIEVRSGEAGGKGERRGRLLHAERLRAHAAAGRCALHVGRGLLVGRQPR